MLAFFTFSLFLSACSCGVKVTEKSNPIKNSSSSSLPFTSNHYPVHYGEISNYTQLTNLVHYQYYVLSNIHNGTKQTNYYFTNRLMTNTHTNFLSNSYQTAYPNFIVGFYTNAYSVIRDNNNILGYSNTNIFVSHTVKTNSITFFNLHLSNRNSWGTTSYNNKFYLTDFIADKVYIYSSTGTYQTNFNLHSANNSAQGITAYNDKFYIADLNDAKVYIYSSNLTYQTNFELHSANSKPTGIISYNNKFYVTDFITNKLFIYSSNLTYQTNFELHSANSKSIGIIFYNNKFYIRDYIGSKVYIYSSTGTYEANFDLHVYSRSITVYNNTLYCSWAGGIFNRLYLYPLD